MPLVSTQALAERLASRPDKLRIFDATVHLRPATPGPYSVESGRADYEAAHIPSAAFADLSADLSDAGSPLRFTLPPVPQLEAALSALGLRNDDECVLYSSGSPMWATRLWWMLRGLGFDARVLDGGLAKWRAEGRPVMVGNERYPAGSFHARPRSGLWAAKAEVRRAIGDGAVCTINALSASAHAGTAAVHYGRPGHIAGSVNVPYASLLDADGTFAPLEQLRAAFDAVGAMSRPRVICYCGGGISATMDALALTLLGHGNVAVYDGSLSEWVLDPALPMATGS
jgi:thiosulfate/3-mercaptopyruvate sulfurtransferase